MKKITRSVKRSSTSQARPIELFLRHRLRTFVDPLHRQITFRSNRKRPNLLGCRVSKNLIYQKIENLPIMESMDNL